MAPTAIRQQLMAARLFDCIDGCKAFEDGPGLYRLQYKTARAISAHYPP